MSENFIVLSSFFQRIVTNKVYDSNMFYTKIATDDTRDSATPSLPITHKLQYIARGFALFFAGFSLLNLLGSLYILGFNANNWWIDFHSLRAVSANSLLLIFTICLLGFGLGLRAIWWRTLSFVVCFGVLTAVGSNILAYYRLRAHGAFFTSPPLPVSLLLFAALLLILFGLASAPAMFPTHRTRSLLLFTLLLCMLGFPLAQIFLFGTTDYRRPADVIVVLGAKAYADGTCSSALADRVRTACQLYQQGWAPRLIMSGGPAAPGMSEPEAMRRLAIQLGVPNSAILLDDHGLNTHATVRNTTAMFTRYHLRRVLVVSHFFHLPRIKMAYQRLGWNVFTVPAFRPQIQRRELPFLVLREVAGLWSYYLSPLWGG